MAQFALAEDLGTLLGRTLEATEVAQADLMLQLASAAIQTEAAGQALEFVADDEVELVGNWGWMLWLPQRPVTDVTEIAISNPYGGVDETVELSQVVWTRRGRVRRNKGWCWNHSYWGGDDAVVRVTYSHGYEVVPDDLKGVCLEVAKRAFANPEGIEIAQEAVEGSISLAYTKAEATGALDLTDAEKRIARRYRPVNA